VQGAGGPNYYPLCRSLYNEMKSILTSLLQLEG
jgi:hypothetical protein